MNISIWLKISIHSTVNLLLAFVLGGKTSACVLAIKYFINKWWFFPPFFHPLAMGSQHNCTWVPHQLCLLPPCQQGLEYANYKVTRSHHHQKKSFPESGTIQWRSFIPGECVVTLSLLYYSQVYSDLEW